MALDKQRKIEAILKPNHPAQGWSILPPSVSLAGVQIEANKKPAEAG